MSSAAKLHQTRLVLRCVHHYMPAPANVQPLIDRFGQLLQGRSTQRDLVAVAGPIAALHAEVMLLAPALLARFGCASMQELLELEGRPFGLLAREAEMRGVGDAMREKSGRISAHLGGRAALIHQ